MPVTYIAVCDRCGRRQDISSRDAPGLTEEGHREVLRRFGWKLPEPGKDICPRCVKAAKEAKP